MTKLSIVTLPDPILRKVSAPVERVDDEPFQLIEQLIGHLCISWTGEANKLAFFVLHIGIDDFTLLA